MKTREDHEQAAASSVLEESITITDRAARRRFIRSGSVFLLGGAVVGTSIGSSTSALASDCDRGGSGEEKTPEQAGNGSDGDSGSGADPAGCGRRYQDKPKISRLIEKPVDVLKG